VMSQMTICTKYVIIEKLKQNLAKRKLVDTVNLFHTIFLKPFVLLQLTRQQQRLQV